MRHRWIFYAIALLSALSCLPVSALADEAAATTTQKAVPAQTDAANTTTTITPPATTTEKPKVKILDSALCKKCTCDDKNKQLDCSKNLTSWFTPAEWETLQNGDIIFETFKLEHNNFTTVPEFPSYPLKNLYLGFNQIASIAVAAFRNLTEITVLGLSNNALTSKALIPDIFKGQYSPSDYLPLKHLIELDLGHNDLHTLHQDLFENLPALQSLYLCGNSIQVIDQPAETAIAGVVSLKTLDISFTELSFLPDNFLHGPRDLEVLLLNGNLFKKLPIHLDYAKNLKRLTLDENPLIDFAGDHVFPELPNLEYLSISYLPNLTQIGDGAFSNLPKLQELVASDNFRLTRIGPQAFSKPTVNPEIFDYPPLQHLYLRNNNISVLERDWLRRWDKVDALDLSFNPWLCDCTNSYLIHTLMTQINGSKSQYVDNVVCATPTEYKSVKLIDINTGTNTKKLNCGEEPNHTDSLILVGLFVGVLIGIPLTIGALVLYRRGCFGLVTSRSSSGTPLYNRASFSDDFHI